MLHVALADDMRRQGLLRAHLAVLENLSVVAFDVVAQQFVMLRVMTRNIFIYNDFKLLKLKQILHRELERGRAITSSRMILHRPDTAFQRLHRLDDRVYHQLRTSEIAAQHIKTAQ